jgi:peptide subunit release factor 1 (eRF1)
MGAARDEVLSLTRPFAERYELETEVQKVNDVVASAKRDGKAVVGLKRTLMAINSDRVWEVIYAGDYLSPGFECSQCAALFSARPSRCPYCGARIQAVVNVVEKAVEHALRRQARVEVVTGNASEALRNAGGIGAFLKTRTGTIES